MRGSIKKGEQWQMITLSEDKDILTKWLWAFDGKEAVVIDDKKQIYYCATEELRDKYKAGGKKALMFIDLALKLHEGTTFDPATSPMWCSTYSLICSEKEMCNDDCCYRKNDV